MIWIIALIVYVYFAFKFELVKDALLGILVGIVVYLLLSLI